MKDAIIITAVTLALICGALSGVVGGAMGMAGTAAILHIIVGS